VQARGTLSRKLTRAFFGYGQQFYDLNRYGAMVAKTYRLPRRGETLFIFLNTVFRSGLALAIYLLAMASLSPLLTVFVVAVLFAYLYAFHRISQRIDSLDDAVGEAEDNLAAAAGDYILNLPLVRLAGMGQKAQSVLDDAADAVGEAQMEEHRVEAVTAPMREILTMAVLIVFALVVSRFMAGVDAALVSRYIVYFLVFRRAMSHFSTLLSAPVKWNKLHLRFGHVFDLLSESGKHAVPAGNVPYEDLGAGITVRGLDFSYVGKPSVLKRVSLEIPAGRRTIVVGSTGSGKSTLFRLLLRQYDCPPSTLFVGGRDIRGFATVSWLRRVAYAGAHPRFFNDTVRNNLVLGLEGISPGALEWAAEQASALDFIRKLERGFDQVIGDRGTTLSSGEQQRLALARVFLKDPELILLDEATSALDNETEAGILRTIDAYAAGRTLVMIAHRLSSLRGDDHVVVLHNGGVAEQGDRDSLLASGGALSRLWQVYEGAAR